MPHSRLLLLATLVIACFVALPASADAAVTLPTPDSALRSVESTVQSTVSHATGPSVQKAAETVARAARPALEAATSAAPQPTHEAAQHVVAPVAAAAEQTVPSAASVVRTAKRSLVHAGAARIARGASAEHLAVGRAAQGSFAQPASAELSPAARAAARKQTPTATAAQPAATPSTDGPERSSGSTGAPFSVPSTSFFFGGGIALLVGALLLTAGPRLRRHLVMPTAVCRPLAFVAVLERPG
ncbi:MAG TPA: hypothetical protein VH683_09460 [Thermoleophilaceae bacterium]|jgi:hypothetical protein